MITDTADSKVSDATLIKHADFTAIVTRQMTASKAIMVKSSDWMNPFYHYVDFNAGSGSPGGIDGSPLIFMRIANELQVPYRAWFCEKSKTQYDELRENVEREKRQYGMPAGSVIYTEWGDHNETVSHILTAILTSARGSSKVVGLAYTDPWGEDDLAIQPLATLARIPRLKMLDMLLHPNPIAYKRNRAAGNRDCYLSVDLKAITHGWDGSIQKRYGWIQRPYGKQQWSTMILTNWADFPKFTKRNIYSMDSPAGIEIERRLNLTDSEREALDNVPLPF